ncbi:ScyD/ScyE family protein [Nocardioides sp. CER19]|uniref:ScyD/ScyE family protein n=1 Tax=Nocardioides sp. CER19 TaxID=3038538 RepID=UPI00244D0780|nr:ScyD/ScyE family protein [Nocardioides sp. CER19]MDH2413682.1 ScyD/ScyE family protein [Nocardioides sp. CER19]
MTFSALSHRGVRVTAALASALALTLAGAASADAHGSHGKHGTKHRHHHGQTQRVLATGLVSPLRAAVAENGTVYVSQNFAGKLTKVRPGKAPTVVYTDPDGNEVGGVSVNGRVVTFTVTKSNDEGPVDSWLKKLYPDGSVRTVADIRAYENAHNPDSSTTYGFRSIDPTCAAKWPADSGPATYTGLPDSHPYATYALRGGWTYVADAGANAVFLVSPRGRIQTVATLPGIPYTLTADAATGLGLDPCFVGHTYWFEPVPTDIELGRGGRLYVTSLPGGPEGDQLDARGSVFTVSARSGRVRQLVDGLLGPTGIAVGKGGSLYVTQLFGDEISKITLRRSGPVVRDFLATSQPAEIESTRRGLYFTDHALADPPAGRLVFLRQR